MNNLNINFNLKDKGVSNALDTINLPRHRWYFYKEGFSPNLVESAIKENELSEDKIIIDPFNGSGTVTLTASLLKMKSIGLEVNPFTSFLSKTKSLNVNPSNFKNEYDKILKSCDKGLKSELEGFSTFSKSKENSNKWLFNLDVLRTFEGGFKYIEGRKDGSSKLLLLALISSIMENCNAKKDGKCLRYRNNWEKLQFDKYSFLNSFDSKCKSIIEDLNFEIETQPMIKTLDSRTFKSSEKISKFDLCITSPPYLNTFDYTDIYRPELFLGRFVKTSQELYNLRLRTVRSHVQAKWEKPDFSRTKSIQLIDMYEKLVEKKDQLMDKDIPLMVLAYFEDMGIVFRNLFENGNENSKIWMVVSTSAYANIHVPVDLILADIATHNGWKLKEIGVLREISKRMTKYSPDISKLRESVIILERE